MNRLRPDGPSASPDSGSWPESGPPGGPQDPTQEACAWTLLVSPDTWRSHEVMSAWTGLLAESKDTNVLYQSPEWFGYREEHRGGDRLAVALARGAGGQVAGVVPLRVAPYYLAFHVAGTTLGGFRLTKLSVRG